MFFSRWQLRHLPQVQAALQEVSLRQVHQSRTRPEVGPDQRREENPIQELLQEKGRTNQWRHPSTSRRYFLFIYFSNIRSVIGSQTGGWETKVANLQKRIAKLRNLGLI